MLDFLMPLMFLLILGTTGMYAVIWLDERPVYPSPLQSTVVWLIFLLINLISAGVLL